MYLLREKSEKISITYFSAEKNILLICINKNVNTLHEFIPTVKGQMKSKSFFNCYISLRR